MEIAEEEEEEERERKRQSVVKEEERTDSVNGDENAGELTRAVTLDSQLANSPEASQFAGRRDPPQFSGIARPSSPAKSFDDAARRMSSQTLRSELYSYSSYPYSKPKVRLAPRPSLDVNGSRPGSSASTGPYRPISAVPAGFKLFSKRTKSHDKTGDSIERSIKEESETNLPASSGLAPETQNSEDTLTRPHTSSGAHGSMSGFSGFEPHTTMPTMPPSLPAAAKKNTISPEKARLMKAMKLRERKLNSKAAADASAGELLPPTPSTPLLPDHIEEEPLSPARETDPAEETTAKQNLSDRLSVSKSDSGIGIDASNDQASVDTRSESHPASPIPSASDLGESTQASSLSESTDETIHPGRDLVEFDSKLDDETEGREQAESSGEKVETEDIAPEASNEIKAETTTEEQLEVEAEPEQHDEEVTEPKQDQEEAETEKTTPELDSSSAVAELSESESDSDDDIVEKQEPRVEVPVAKGLGLPVSKFSTAAARSDQITTTLSEQAARNVAPLATDLTTTADTSHETDVDEVPRSPQLLIPTSKFSTRDSKLPAGPAREDTRVASTPVIAVEPAVSDASIPPSDNEQPSEANESPSIDARRSKRRSFIEPIRTDVVNYNDTAASDANLSDDDDLMNELQSATLEEAQPVVVSKSPISSVFPGSAAPKRATTLGLDGEFGIPRAMTRTVSNPVRGNFLAPGDATTNSARTLSSGAAYLHKITQQPSSDARPKSSKMGSSISQRIKALEKLSSLTGAEDERKERPSSTFFSVRKTARDPSRSPSIADRGNSVTRMGTPSPVESPESSPEAARSARRDRSGSISTRLSVFEGGNLPRGRPDAIQVTARIIREPGQPFPKMPELTADGADYGPLDLKQSPLLVDHQRASRSASPAPLPAVAAEQPPQQEPQPEKKLSLLQRRFSTKGRRSMSEDRANDTADEADKENLENGRPRRRSSLSVVKDFIKERRGSMLPGKSPSTDNFNLSINAVNAAAGKSASSSTSRSPNRPPSVHQNSYFPRRLSISSRRSSIDKSSGSAGADGASTLLGDANGESDAESLTYGSGDRRSGSGSVSGSNAGSAATSPTFGKGNRASRFMRRLSNSLGTGRKNAAPSISPTVAEEDAAEVEAAGRAVSQGRATAGMQPTIVSYMGDVNVQFPDTLLWKRRTMCLDSQGFLILSAVQGVAAAMPLAPTGKDRHTQAGAIKRYHMSDFRPPYIPEMEVQELPNSVVLDFVDGSGIQVACEDRAGQYSVLRSKFLPLMCLQN